MKIVIPKRALVVLSGAAGSGKSTFARRYFKESQILSSDFCRRLVCDQVDWSSHISPAAFRVLHTILEERVRLGKLTVVDSTAIEPDHRALYLHIARRHNVPVYLIVMNIPDTVCIERDLRRRKPVGERAITSQWERLQATLCDVEEEGFAGVFILSQRNQFNSEIVIGMNGASQKARRPRAQARSLPASEVPQSSPNGNGRNAAAKTKKIKQ